MDQREPTFDRITAEAARTICPRAAGAGAAHLEGRRDPHPATCPACQAELALARTFAEPVGWRLDVEWLVRRLTARGGPSRPAVASRWTAAAAVAALLVGGVVTSRMLSPALPPVEAGGITRSGELAVRLEGPTLGWVEPPGVTGYRVAISAASGRAVADLEAPAGSSTIELPRATLEAECLLGTELLARIDALDAAGGVRARSAAIPLCPAGPPPLSITR